MRVELATAEARVVFDTEIFLNDVFCGFIFNRALQELENHLWVWP